VHLNAKLGSADATDPFAVAETSAVGRALGFAGWGSVESICSADELLRVQPGITVIEAGKPLLPPAQPIDEETRARLNTLFQIGKGQGLFSHKKGMAQYTSQILDRTVTAEELMALSYQELDILLDAPNGVGLEAAS
jgi:hypothetical protein